MIHCVVPNSVKLMYPDIKRILTETDSCRPPSEKSLVAQCGGTLMAASHLIGGVRSPRSRLRDRNSDNANGIAVPSSRSTEEVADLSSKIATSLSPNSYTAY